MIIEYQVGPQAVSDGARVIARAAKTGEMCVSEAMPRYYEPAIRAQLYSASNVAAQAVSVALATTYTGLCISNPNGSGVNLVMVGCQYALSVAPAGIASLHLISGFSASSDVTHTAALASPGIQSAIVGRSANSIAKADTQATITNPTYRMSLGSGFTAGALYATTPSWIDLAGQIIVQPGGWVAWGALTAVTGFGSFSWVEVPV